MAFKKKIHLLTFWSVKPKKKQRKQPSLALTKVKPEKGKSCSQLSNYHVKLGGFVQVLKAHSVFKTTVLVSFQMSLTEVKTFFLLVWGHFAKFPYE